MDLVILIISLDERAGDLRDSKDKDEIIEDTEQDAIVSKIDVEFDEESKENVV